MPRYDYNLSRLGLSSSDYLSMTLDAGTVAELSNAQLMSAILTAYQNGSITVNAYMRRSYGNTPGTGITTTTGDFKTSLNWEGMFVVNRVPMHEGEIVILKDGAPISPHEVVVTCYDAPSLENLADSEVVDLLDSDGEQLISY